MRTTLELLAACLAIQVLVSGCGRGDVPTEEASQLVAEPQPVAEGTPAGVEMATPMDAVEQLPRIHLAGEAFLRERIALPRDASLLVRLVELDHGGKVSAEVARVEVPSPRRQPIPFELTIDEAELKDGVDYGLTAVISRRGVHVFSTDAPLPVLEPGSQTMGLRLLLRRSG